MTVFQAIVYGIIQGLGEFLPISSSAHLIAAPQILGWRDPGLTFDVALHLGTLVAVAAYFWKDLVQLVKAGFSKPGSKDGKLFWFIAFASIPGAIIGKIFEKQAESSFRNLALIGTMLIIMGIILYLVDKMGRKEIEVENVSLGKSLWIGVSQALAIVPGVSRSGITMSTGLLLGLTRESAARFSFLLSTPIILGAGLLKLKDIIHTPLGDKAPFIAGIVTSAIVGFLSIKFLLDYLRDKGFGIFAIYRFIAGGAFILIYFLR